MYQIGDYIIYGGEGVCRVTAVGAAPVAAVNQDKTYYTLQPVYHGGVIYAPADVPIRMRPVLNREEAQKLIRDIPGMTSKFEHFGDAKQAAQEYKTVLQTYECENLLHLIRMIYSKNQTAIESGKGCGQTDDRFLKRAKELLYGELAIALDIPFEKVEETIVAAVENYPEV